MAIYTGVKTFHNFGYQRFSAYQYATDKVSNGLSVVTRFIPEEIKLTVYKIVYVILYIAPKIIILTASMLVPWYKKRSLENISQALFGSMIWILFDALNVFYPYDILTNLNAAYQRRSLPPTVLNEIVNAKLVTHLRGGHSVILHGPSGCGKSAAICALAQEMGEGRCAALDGKIVYSLCLQELLADPSFFLQRLVDVLNVVRLSPHIILAIDEIQRLTERVHGVRIADLLKIHLEKNSSQGKNRFVQIIGATTTKELEKIEKEDAAFIRRFFQLDVSSKKDPELLKQMVSKHFSNESFALLPGALEKAIAISEEYYPELALPGRAIKVLDAVYAMRLAGSDLSPITEGDIDLVIQKDLIERRAESKKER